MDALIAEKVMGWTEIEKKLGESGDPVWMGRAKLSDESLSVIPPYSTDVADCWDVYDKLKLDGYKVSVTADVERDRWVCYIAKGASVDCLEGSHNVALTICTAALKAVGGDSEAYLNPDNPAPKRDA
jgi:hypothetical protein